MNFSKQNHPVIPHQKYFVLRTLLLLVSIFTFYISSFAQESNSFTINISIDNVMNNYGKVIFSLHNNYTFMTKESIQSAENNIDTGKVEVSFKDVKPGNYAIMALHDENENYQMDFDINGRPLENYGMSNNPISYGPPQFEYAKFKLTDKDLNLKIRF